MTKRFSGWHMTAILVGGFAVVVAVNLLMASLAVGSFGGVVVENSYVASQNFNRWLDEARRENTLGWQAQILRGGDGRLEVRTAGIPAGAVATAELRHPLGKVEQVAWTLEALGPGRFVSAARLPEGRWLVRVTLTHGSQRMKLERPLG